MNERIKQLAEQAKLWAMDNTNFPISSHIPAGYTEKFAELIMKECIRVPYDMWDKAELNADIAVKIEHRIREIAQQAGLQPFEDCGPGYVYKMEKFAELLIQECLAIAKNREDELESAGLISESNAVGNVAYRISRQFGVKR